MMRRTCAIYPWWPPCDPVGRESEAGLATQQPNARQSPSPGGRCPLPGSMTDSSADTGRPAQPQLRRGCRPLVCFLDLQLQGVHQVHQAPLLQWAGGIPVQPLSDCR